MKLLKIIKLVSILSLICITEVFAFPPFVPVEDRVKESAVVLIGNVTKVETHRHVGRNKIVRVRMIVQETLKGTVPKKSFGLTFLVFPENEESHLIKPPRKGKYLFFLIWKKVIDSKGRTGYTLVLYEPRVYSYLEATEDNIRKIKLFLKK